MRQRQILDTVRGLGVGDKIIINRWKRPFVICGVSNHYVLAWDEGEEYTIIRRDPLEYGPYNGIPKGAIVCASDWWTCGYEGGYHFDSRAWIMNYLRDLETGKTEMSVRHREEIKEIRLWPAKGGNRQ